jgi:hypothetical protein
LRGIRKPILSESSDTSEAVDFIGVCLTITGCQKQSEKIELAVLQKAMSDTFGDDQKELKIFPQIAYGETSLDVRVGRAARG